MDHPTTQFPHIRQIPGPLAICTDGGRGETSKNDARPCYCGIMRKLTPIKESAAGPDPALLIGDFSPLSEAAIRKDGTMGIKIIGPGWGASGYYAQEILKRDIPKVFPSGTQMFWNHDTPTEESERPEGDLSRLAAVTVSQPIWLDNGPKGPGMYADARPFSGYAGTIDEIGDHIGVSIRALGRHTMGEAEGRQGPIIQELVAGKSVDFVTVAGAGGAILRIFEAAPGAAVLPPPTIQAFLKEAGRVLSAANEKKLRAALAELSAVLSVMDETSEAGAKLAEARNVAEWLESRLHLQLTTLADDMFGEGRINREERIAMSRAISPALDAYRATLLEMAPELYKRDIWAAAPDSADLDAIGVNESEEMTMNEQEYQQQIAERDQSLAEANKAIVEMRAQLLARECRDLVATELAATELPELIKLRLARQLAANPALADGKLDETATKTAVATAVNEARAEIAALNGSNGAITGMGENVAANGQPAPVVESKKRIETALAAIGYKTA